MCVCGTSKKNSAKKALLYTKISNQNTKIPMKYPKQI